MTATIAFLGTGSMNGSIAAGLLAAGHDPAHIRATVRSEESRAALAQRLGDKVEIITTGGEADGNHKATAHADVVLLGVKPYGIVELARDIAPALAPNAVVVSVAAGVTLETLAECLPAGQPIVRCMPNTPSSVGKGVLAISTTDTVKDEQKKLVEEVLGTVGLVVEVREDQMDAVTAVSGSGPAYAFLLAEAGPEPETAVTASIWSSRTCLLRRWQLPVRSSAWMQRPPSSLPAQPLPVRASCSIPSRMRPPCAAP